MLKNMNPRERLMVAMAVAFIVITVGWLGVWEPAVERRDTLRMKIEAKKQEIAQVAQLSSQYLAIKARFSRLESKVKDQQGGFSPLGVMENIAASAGLKENVISMSPQPSVEIEGYQESLVSLKLDKVELTKLIAFLKLIRESKSYLNLKRIAIKPLYENPEWLSVSLSISGYEPVR